MTIFWSAVMAVSAIAPRVLLTLPLASRILTMTPLYFSAVAVLHLSWAASNGIASNAAGAYSTATRLARALSELNSAIGSVFGLEVQPEKSITTKTMQSKQAKKVCLIIMRGSLCLGGIPVKLPVCVGRVQQRGSDTP